MESKEGGKERGRGEVREGDKGREKKGRKEGKIQKRR